VGLPDSTLSGVWMSSLQVRLQPGREGGGVNILRIFQTESGPPPWSDSNPDRRRRSICTVRTFLILLHTSWSPDLFPGRTPTRCGGGGVYCMYSYNSLVRLTPGGIPDSCKILDSADSKLVGRKGGVLLQLPTP